MVDAVAVSFRGEIEGGGILEVAWNHEWARVTTNKNGTTGWGRVVSTSVPIIPQGSKLTPIEVGSVIRIHKCAHKPCTVQYPDAKYGVYGPPAHVLETCSLPAVAESVSSILLAPSAEEVVPPEVPLPPVFVLIPAVIATALPLPATAAVIAPTDMDDDPSSSIVQAEMEDVALPMSPSGVSPIIEEDLPAIPVAASLRCVPAALPAAAALCDVSPRIDAGDCSTAVAGGCLHEPALAEVDLMDSLIHLARQIRRERNYVGYSFFILFGLLKKCRPVVWEGTSKIDLLETFAPWALDEFTRSCGVEAVCCCFEVSESHASMCPVSERHPLAMCRHYVACTAIPEGVDFGGSSFESFYHQLGVALLGTVMDGDCGLDVACQMEGVAQALEDRIILREDPF